uniref:Uncharacterized protein n=1 Tax=Oryza rufipogon TaxID=4529 RepID=A0A0E0NX32_ORYRU
MRQLRPQPQPIVHFLQPNGSDAAGRAESASRAKCPGVEGEQRWKASHGSGGGRQARRRQAVGAEAEVAAGGGGGGGRRAQER